MAAANHNNAASHLTNSSKLHHLSIPQLLNGHGGGSAASFGMRSSSQDNEKQ